MPTAQHVVSVAGKQEPRRTHSDQRQEAEARLGATVALRRETGQGSKDAQRAAGGRLSKRPRAGAESRKERQQHSAAVCRSRQAVEVRLFRHGSWSWGESA